MAAGGGESLPGVLVLDAFGHDSLAEAVSQVDGRMDDRGVGGVEVHPGDEGTVDLDLADRDSLQVHERGDAGAEVVER